ncbi:MAG: bifunctional (p)ppGpp synthetase/guanosine-3',5'-bis(diphosphate) 3'-pyrophosphohydrolase [Pseudomonadota bacterium]|nr:bifunctional (p)ppGpp synthetase/guanosine-3',5'-bis(diphosphate) 3'-pyrophosphohydrolase [Pseudomonadota bacterium]MDQ3228215.1 bifunctional (p)ppGpp synthetase/guanosine-3',5'-bis(diphosphate) 3'-pyrophosphohydrolase [Pseudomonadota bacterium]
MSPALQSALADAAAHTAAFDAEDGLPSLHDTLDSLARLSADGEVVAATLLHTLPGLQATLAPRLKREFAGVHGLLEGQKAAGQVWALHGERTGSANAEGLRRLLLAIVRDLRVVPILLARHLARMRASGNAPEAERRGLAQLARDIHAPLANRLGIWQLKWELEDLAFRYLEPDTFQRIAHLLDEKRTGRERYIQQVAAALHDALGSQGVIADVAGRPKHIYSIWKKMQKKDVPFGELYDLRAVRVLVGDIPACYTALGVVHALWVPIPSEFDDYIARPKRNDYRSLHTAVSGPEGKTLEVQIRTHEMHAQAELGVAAHWRYKEGSAGGNAAQDRKIAWMRRLLDGNADGARNAQDLSGALDTELVEDRIYALTPKGEVIDLAQGATPLDFAYQVHTEVGHRCRGAKVDGRIVPLGYKLRSGNRVEILTAKVGEPRRDWLIASNGFLASPRSREKVRNWFHKLDHARNVQAGRELLDREMKRLGLHNADLSPVLAKFNSDSVDELHVHVALGDVGPHQVGRALHEHEHNAASPSQAAVSMPTRGKVPKPAKTSFTVQGVGNLLMQLARCCQPVPGDVIAGYLTRGRGVSVHRDTCAAFARLAAAQPQRVLPVEWGRAGGGYDVDVLVVALDRKWLLKELTNLIAQEDAHIGSIASDVDRSSGRVRFKLRLRVGDFGQLSALLGKLAAVPGVHEAHRAG